MLSIGAMIGTCLALVRAAVLAALAASSSAPAAGSPASLPPSSLLALSDSELGSLVEAGSASLGSLSIGSPSGGVLFNGIGMPSGQGWEVITPAESLGTTETLAFVGAAIEKVNEIYPGSPPLSIGDISDAEGGRLNRHISHQAGRDVDLGFYYRSGRGVWHTPGTKDNLDLPRNWALVRTLLLCTDVESILLDLRIQRLLYAHALSIGEDKAWLDRAFRFVKGAKEARIIHASGHRTHFHIRFYNPVAQELGRRAYPHLVRLDRIKPPVYTVAHRVREGQTLGEIARRYGVTVRSVQQYNGLSSTLIRAGRTYRIPLKGVAAPTPGPLIVPFRMLAPRTPASLAAFDWPTPLGMYGEALLRLACKPLLVRAATLP